MADQEEFQVAPKRGGSSNNKRVYIGNLPNSLESRQALEESLERWMHDQIPNLSIESLQVNMSGHGKYPHALLDCGGQANQVIRLLHQQHFHGQKLTVQREKRNNNNNNNNNNTSNKNNRSGPKKKGFGANNWAAPPPTSPADQKSSSTTSFTPIPVDQASRDIKSVVEDEFRNAEETKEDPINVALASTAAASLLAVMNGFGEDEPVTVPVDNDDDNDAPTNWEQKRSSMNPENYEDDKPDEPTTFQMKPMAELLTDFGQADPNWKNKQVDTSAQSSASNKDAPTSQLAPKGKAPIHICFTSFGFSKGAPKRMDGWSYRQPLLPLDCREYTTVPGFLAWQDGLSGAVKRALQFPQDFNHGRGRDEVDKTSKKKLHDFACQDVATQVWEALVDAQNHGGHGYLSPLEMTVYVGSESGRHRSVVVCEWAATQVRKMLRANKDHKIQQPVSVGTFHRDVGNHRQQQYKLKDENRKIDMPQGKTLRKKQMEMAGDW